YFADGMALAAVDAFEATIYGDGGHGASPHTGSDPLFILSNVLPHVYGIPGRRVAPLESCIVSLGSIHAGKAMNVIPGEVYINGTIRTFSDEVRATVHEELERSFKFAEVMGGSYELSINKGYPAMYNTASVNDVMRGVTGEFAGAEAIVNGTFGMGAEDFSYMTTAAPGAMFMLGADNGGGAHHTSLFDIDEDVFPMGAAVLAETARRYVTGEAQM
ncbi:MAG: M20/M25/M40 family metallo-hydrolase, partial [Chloroflexota bacterium]